MKRCCDDMGYQGIEDEDPKYTYTVGTHSHLTILEAYDMLVENGYMCTIYELWDKLNKGGSHRIGDTIVTKHERRYPTPGAKTYKWYKSKR